MDYSSLVENFKNGDYSTFADFARMFDEEEFSHISLVRLRQVDKRHPSIVALWLKELLDDDHIDKHVYDKMYKTYRIIDERVPMNATHVTGDYYDQYDDIETKETSCRSIIEMKKKFASDGDVDSYIAGLSANSLLRSSNACGPDPVYGLGCPDDNYYEDAIREDNGSGSSDDEFSLEDAVIGYNKPVLITSNIRLNRATPFSAGHDLSSIEEGVVPAKCRAAFDTGVILSIPDGYYGQIQSRSGLAFRNGIIAMPGVIDSDYTTAVKILLFNHNDEDFAVKKGDRIAQIVFLKYYASENCNIIDSTSGKHEGFGSSGSNISDISTNASDIRTNASTNISTGVCTSSMFP
jgi:dUTP pyrophosphatase